MSRVSPCDVTPTSFEATLRSAPQDEGYWDTGASLEILILRRSEAALKDVDFGPTRLDDPADASNLRHMQSKLDFAIVPAGPSDADGLAGVHVQSWRETYPGILPSGYLERMSAPLHARRWRSRLMQLNEITLVAESAEGLVGFCSGDWARGRGPETTEAEVHTLYVLKSAQGLGVGRRLMAGAVRALAARGATSLHVAVLRDNLPARVFYEHLGGSLDGEHVELVGGASVAAVDYRWEDLAGFGG